MADIGSSPTPELGTLMAAHPDSWPYLPTDVTQLPQIDALIKVAASRFGPITTLYNHTAIFDMAPLLESDETMCDKIFAVNVKGAFFVLQKVLTHMVAHQLPGYAVINMASQTGQRGEALVSHYCASKAAIISYTQSAALAMAPHNFLASDEAACITAQTLNVDGGNVMS